MPKEWLCRMVVYARHVLGDELDRMLLSAEAEGPHEVMIRELRVPVDDLKTAIAKQREYESVLRGLLTDEEH